ncbi:anion permease [Candidatus Bipolaricaulota bacterium]|nr:anion permease [Candidatus Bipolaricaulota bacterium]MBS3813783.1 anion permease [Candidatus Bipolaricaulota bacterium]MBS3825215.1 anion permease [Candidatus Bipolaricaulota bacterium]
MLVLLILVGVYVGWNIGANDTANCMGIPVGSGLITYRKMIFLVAIFVVLGALLQSHQVMETIGEGVARNPLNMKAVFVAMFSAGIFVSAATFLKIPVSTSQAIVGGVIGAAISMGSEVNLGQVLTIAEVWVLNPPLTALISFLLYHLLAFFLKRVKLVFLWDRLLSYLVIASGGYVAFSLGANTVGTSVGPLAALGIDKTWLALMAGAAVSVGTLTYGKKVTKMVGEGITSLDPLSAVAAQLSAAGAVNFFAYIGIPVSTSQAIVGAVIGVGLVKGVKTVSAKKIMKIAVGWVASPTAAALFAFGLYKVLEAISFF